VKGFGECPPFFHVKKIKQSTKMDSYFFRLKELEPRAGRAATDCVDA
jgi:hypothetical protein